MPEKVSPASAFLPVVSCLSPALAFRSQGSVRYRWSRISSALPSYGRLVRKANIIFSQSALSLFLLNNVVVKEIYRHFMIMVQCTCYNLFN
jgi:hypothetical protein